MNQGGPVWPRECHEVLMYDFQSQVVKACSFHLGGWDFLFWGKAATHHGDAQAGLWRCSHREGLRYPVNSQHQRASHVSEPPWKWILSPNHTFKWLKITDSEAKSPSPATPVFLTHGNHKKIIIIIIVLGFGVTCCIAMVARTRPKPLFYRLGMPMKNGLPEADRNTETRTQISGSWAGSFCVLLWI